MGTEMSDMLRGLSNKEIQKRKKDCDNYVPKIKEVLLEDCFRAALSGHDSILRKFSVKQMTNMIAVVGLYLEVLLETELKPIYGDNVYVAYDSSDCKITIKISW